MGNMLLFFLRSSNYWKIISSFMEIELILLMWLKTFSSAFKQAVLHPYEKKNMIGLYVKAFESNQAGSGF